MHFKPAGKHWALNKKMAVALTSSAPKARMIAGEMMAFDMPAALLCDESTHGK
jgi:hypothetical protein